MKQFTLLEKMAKEVYKLSRVVDLTEEEKRLEFEQKAIQMKPDELKKFCCNNQNKRA
jgi:hypothetical protein